MNDKLRYLLVDTSNIEHPDVISTGENIIDIVTNRRENTKVEDRDKVGIYKLMEI
jgi:hypothetical protein